MLRFEFMIGVILAAGIATAAAQPPAAGSKAEALPVEIVALTQHTQDVNSVVLSGDEANRFVASAGEDGVIKLWDVMTGRLIRNVVRIDPSNKYWQVKFLSADGRRLLAAVGADFKLWDTLTGREILSLTNLQDGGSILVARDGGRIAVLHADKILKVFDGHSGKELSTLRNASSLTLSADRKPVASMGAGKTVELWSEVAVEVTHGPDDKVSDYGTRLHVEADGATLRLRERQSERVTRTIAGRFQPDAIAFASNGARMAAAGPDTIAILDTETGQQVGTCPKASDRVAGLAFSSDGQRLLYDGKDKTVALCDIESGTIIRSYVGHDASVSSVAFSPSERQLASGDEMGTVKLWEVATGHLMRTLKGQGRSADSIAFTPDGRKVLAGTSDNKVRIWEVTTGRETKTLRMLLGPVTAMDISPDGRRVGAGPYSQLMAKQWEIETGRELKRLETSYIGRFWGVTDLKYAPEGTHAVAAAGNNLIVAWDSDSGRKKFEIEIRDQDFKTLAFSGDGRRLVSADEAGVIRHWEASTGVLLVTIIRFEDGEWLRVTPEGFFESSADGGKYLSVVRGLEVYPVDPFRKLLDRPDLVREKLAGDRHGTVRIAAAKLDLAHAVAEASLSR